MDKGVIFVATGKNYVEELLRCLDSIERLDCSYNVAVASDLDVNHSMIDERIDITPSYDYEDKIKAIKKTPYDKTLYLDTDVHVYEQFGEIFELLDNFELAAAHATGRVSNNVEGVPKSFPEFNTGVIAFRSNSRVFKFFENWERMHSDNDWIHDQPAFRKVLYNSNIRLATLTPEYNCKFDSPTFVSGDVKIFHGRWRRSKLLGTVQRGSIYDFMEKVDKKRNRFGERIIIPRFTRMKIYDGGLYSTFKIVSDAIENEEYRWLLEQIKYRLGLSTEPKNYKS